MLYITKSAKTLSKSKKPLATHVGHIQKGRINLLSVLIHKLLLYQLSLLNESVSTPVLAVEEKPDSELWLSTST